MFGLIPFEKKDRGLQKGYDDFFNIDRVFENFFNDMVFPSYYTNSGQMKVDIKDTGKEYVLETEIPGVNKEDIGIEIDENKLVISVEKKEDKEEKKENYIRKERRNFSMTRSFSLDNVDSEKVSAKYENGLLILNLPKKQESKPTIRKVKLS